MSEPLSTIYYRNALTLLKAERRNYKRVNDVYVRLGRIEVRAGVEDWLGNPFISTALSILEKLTSNYKIKQAVQLLKEAATESKKESESKKKRR